MDHLLYPTGTSIPTFRIPLLCDDQTFYNGNSFTTVPFRKGWASESNSHQWLQCSDEELARRVQIWLYFGLLSAFCGCNVSSASLCCVDENTHYRYLSIARLYDLLEKRKNLTNGRNLIKEALHYSDLVEQRVTADIGPLHLVSCSVRVLLQTLNSTQGLQIKTINSTQRYHMGQRWPLKWSEGLFENWRLCPAKAILYKMETLGWCPSQISHLTQKYSCYALYYLSGLPVDRSVNHSQCTKSACSAYNIDESSYISRHTLTCIGHKCSLIEVSTLRVSSIIEDGFGIPVISCSIDSGDRVRPEIIRVEAGQEYTAISHVWSGGLGNPNHNGLPECQVHGLIDRIRRLQRLTCKRKGVQSRIRRDKEVLFWMDTFCIPVGENHKLTRRKAIDSMALIYSNASAILVLDPELQKITYGGLSIEQALALVLRSSWMSRCWTLQEASLSKAWFIQFNDNPINIADAAKLSSVKGTLDFLIGRGKPLPSIKRALIAELSRFLIDMSEVQYQRRGRYSRSEIWNLKQLESHQALSFATAWNNFQGRTTSKKEDLHQILAGMADIRAGGLRDFALEDRMKAIIKCHASLPIDILFCPSERMHGEDPANAWAPNSPQGQRLDETFGSMKVFTDCLHISEKTRSEYLQICFGQSEALLADRFQVDIPTVGRFWVEIDKIVPEQHHKSQNRSICLMFPTLGSDSKVKVWSEILGARFIIRKQEGNNLHIIYDSPFRMFSYDRGDNKPSNDNPAWRTYPYAPTELAQPDSRIFIDCCMSSISIPLNLHQVSNSHLTSSRILAHRTPILLLPRRTPLYQSSPLSPSLRLYHRPRNLDRLSHHHPPQRPQI